MYLIVICVVSPLFVSRQILRVNWIHELVPQMQIIRLLDWRLQGFSPTQIIDLYNMTKSELNTNNFHHVTLTNLLQIVSNPITNSSFSLSVSDVPRPKPPYSHKPKQPTSPDAGAGLVPVTWSVIALCYCLAQLLYVWEWELPGRCLDGWHICRISSCIWETIDRPKDKHICNSRRNTRNRLLRLLPRPVCDNFWT